MLIQTGSGHITAAMSGIAAVILTIYSQRLKKMKKLLFVFYSLEALTPNIAFAASKINTILTNIQDTLNIVIKILITLALVVFIWGIVRFIAAAGNIQEVKKAKGIMLYGIIALAILATMTGIITFLQTYFGISPGQPIIIPQFPPK